MARLNYINYQEFDAVLTPENRLGWAPTSKITNHKLPQIFWADGSSWAEVNLWALTRALDQRIKPDTVQRTMKHLRHYAAYLEEKKLDWRHFPIKKEEGALRTFRKRLVDAVDDGNLGNSTASNCMAAVIQFYRFAEIYDLVGAAAPMWVDKSVVIPFHDSKGFKRTMTRQVSELAISNRRRAGQLLEDGLLPLRSEHMSQCLRYTAEHETEELHTMLATGFFTGARIGTITTLTVTSLDTAREDPMTPGVFLLPVGPGTGVATKFSVSGNIMVPEAVLAELRRFATSTTRLLRERKAKGGDKNRLFLTRSGEPYSVAVVNRLVHGMRKRAVAAGMTFMENFTFHQSRATFGTWLVQLLLEVTSKTEALRIVRDAMLHKHESTTLGYIKFIENTKAKANFAAQFNSAFTGLRERDWSNLNA